MRILVASDKFKGSLTAAEACNAIASGIDSQLPPGSFELRQLPIADGGDGIADAITHALSGQWIKTPVRNARGETVVAGYGLIENGKVAVIEMAEASGLAQLGHEPLDPWNASTAGTGELIQHAISQGVDQIILGIGGSATNDGGSGMAQALGFSFSDEQGKPVADVPSDLLLVHQIDPPENANIPAITVACDVTNPLLGPEGCTRIYGPQKGVALEEMERHEARLSHLVSLTGSRGAKAATAPGAGAAGGLGFGCLVFTNATLVPGFDLVAGLLQIEDAVIWADLVITGEGKLDGQSLQGKAPFGIASMARRAGKSTAAFCGRLEGSHLETTFGPITEIRRPELSLEENMRRGKEFLRASAAEAISSLLPQSK